MYQSYDEYLANRQDKDSWACFCLALWIIEIVIWYDGYKRGSLDVLTVLVENQEKINRLRSNQ